VRVETILAELNKMRKDIGEDQSDLEWLAVHHAFVFLSYKTAEFQKYLEEETRKGAFKAWEEENA
jgi:hypothetical protein